MQIENEILINQEDEINIFELDIKEDPENNFIHEGELISFWEL